MLNIVVLVTVIVVILSFLLKYEAQNADMIYVTSDLDGLQYLVRNHADKKQAADMLATIRSNMVKLVNYLKENFISDERVQLLVNRFNPDVLQESLANSSQTSYSLDKGRKIVFCLRSKDEKQEFVDMNTMMFVAVHEMAHVMTKDIGHTENFWENMRFLLKKAIKISLYTKVDYSKNPKQYCGVSITSTVLQPDD
jgi:predicted metal-dependent hydrolase